MIESSVDRIQSAMSEAILSIHPVAGGSVGDAWHVTTGSGQWFVKCFSADACADSSQGESWLAPAVAEAKSLQQLRQAETSLNIPKASLATSDTLVLEWIEAGKPAPDYWDNLAQGLWQLHQTTSDSFGLDFDNYCGATRQINLRMENGWDFFAEQRLKFQTRMARDKGLLSASEATQLDRLAARLEQLIPDSPPALLHGDLWSGNVMVDSAGTPALIDPSCYFGWFEAELATTTLFGGFSERFYQHYEATAGIDASWRERAMLYNLYHLLNHLNLFGGSYHQSVLAVLGRYA